MQKPYCLLPFIHFHVGDRGQVNACCVAKIPFGNINEASLVDIWNGEAINEIRSKFLNGETDKRCEVCHKLEASGAKSIRQETLEKFPNLNVSHHQQYPVYFDIRFSNVCNFRCRTCWHGASSKWFKDAKALGTNMGQEAIIKNIHDFDNFISQNGDALKYAQEFYFAGGEPLVTEEHYRLLQWLVDNKLTSARLRYNTNFSKLSFKNYRALELWKHFPNVEILASIDASQQLGEYIRKDMVWNSIVENRRRINNHGHIKFKIAPTISILNVAAIPNLYAECLSLGMIGTEDLYINILERPAYYNVQALPIQQKEKVAAIYLEAMKDSNPLMINKAFQEILDYMFLEDRSQHYATFLQKTQEIDRLRKEEYPIENIIT
jgi:MoaA/NifB/PqqE/SkfB family radical SAM enzyme